ncbi:MAG: hypothetical protein OXT63_02050 [Gemmatimonadota bacterium]|nr:hypothetical protein [Gemmatimonadota bacterium]
MRTPRDFARTRRKFVEEAALGVAGLGLLPAAAWSCREAPDSGESGDASSDRATRPATGTGLLQDPRYLDHVLIRPDGGRPPEIPDRLVRIREELVARGLDEATVPLAPATEAMPHIEAHHTPEHVASIRELEVSGPVAELAVAGALTAIDAVVAGQVRNAFCAVRPPGHHANNTGAEEGFCYYSGVPVGTNRGKNLLSPTRIARSAFLTATLNLKSAVPKQRENRLNWRESESHSSPVSDILPKPRPPGPKFLRQHRCDPLWSTFQQLMGT